MQDGSGVGEKDLRVAIVHDWLATVAGAEKVLRELLRLFPQADLFSIVDFLSNDQRKQLFGKRANTSFIQHLPGAKRHFRNYLPLFSSAVESWDLDSYDLVISSSWAFAKGVKTRGKHLCYCHTPIRYAWDMMDEYTKDLFWPKKMIVRSLLHQIRSWDRKSANRVDSFVANSSFVAKRIEKIYHRQSRVVHPPVDTQKFRFWPKKEDFYLTVSRLVPYKKTRHIVEAFSKMPDKKLLVVGDGEELELLRQMATPNIMVMGYQEDEKVVNLMQRARAFIYAALEDFGIVMAEAQACGTPVIAYGKGGALDIVDEECGIFFQKQSADAIEEAVERFEKERFDYEWIAKRAQRFSRKRFHKEIADAVQKLLS